MNATTKTIQGTYQGVFAVPFVGGFTELAVNGEDVCLGGQGWISKLQTAGLQHDDLIEVTVTVDEDGEYNRPRKARIVA